MLFSPKEKGQSLVEFALILLLVFLVVAILIAVFWYLVVRYLVPILFPNITITIGK